MCQYNYESNKSDDIPWQSKVCHHRNINIGLHDLLNASDKLGKRQFYIIRDHY